MSQQQDDQWTKIEELDRHKSDDKIVEESKEESSNIEIKSSGGSVESQNPYDDLMKSMDIIVEVIKQLISKAAFMSEFIR